MDDHPSRAHQLLASVRPDEARIYLEKLLRQDPKNLDLLYNLGPYYMDLGQLDQGLELLHCCLQLVPEHSTPAWSWHSATSGRVTFCKRRSTPCGLWPPISGTPWPSRTWAPSSAKEGDGSLLPAAVLRDRSQRPEEHLQTGLRLQGNRGWIFGEKHNK